LFLTSPALADSTIDLLTAGAALTGTEKLPMFQTANPAVTTTPSALKTFVTATGVVTSVTNSDGTLTFTGTSAVVGSLALGHANTWSGVQSFTNGDLSLLGATSGNTLLEATAAAGAGTVATFPANTGIVAELNLAQTFSAIQTFSATNGIVYSGAATGTQVACLGLDASNNVIKSAAACGSGGGGTPGGAASSIQYNNAGAFGGFGFADGSANTQIVNTSATTTAQSFKVYNTWSGGALPNPTNYERATIDWVTTANTLTIGTEALGTGTARDISFSIPSNHAYFNGPSTLALDINSSTLQIRTCGVCTFAFSLSNNGTGSADVGIGRVAAKVVGFLDGNWFNGTNTGWMNWQGEQRTTAATTYTSNTTLSTILTANLQAARTYSFDIYIPVTASLSTGGIKVALAGTATVTSMIADSWVVSNNAITNQVQVTSLTTLSNGLGGAATGAVRVQGTITVNAAGTFLVQTAQNTSSATATVVGQGARLMMHDMP
jgi:hypothetical protein